MANKDLRAQMDAARAAAAFIGAAQEEETAPKPRRSVKTRTGRTSASGSSSATSGADSDGSTSASTKAAGTTATKVSGAKGAGKEKPAASKTKQGRRKAESAHDDTDSENARMTAQVLVPMTADQREHADLLASVMKVTRAEIMRQALDEYWDNHKAELQAAVAAYEEIIRKLMK